MRILYAFAVMLAALFIHIAPINVLNQSKQDEKKVEKNVDSEPVATTPVEIETCIESLGDLPQDYLKDERLNADRLIVVFKRAYKVGLYKHGKLITEDEITGCFPISMGETPFNPKYRRDYASTPEGWYYVGAKRTSDPKDEFPETSFYKSLFVSYPNLDDIDRALERDVIDESEAKNMRRKIALGEVPQQNSAMGGAILIHAWYTTYKNATLGCVGVDNENMDWIFDRVENKDPILLLPWRTIMYTDGTFARDDSVQKSLSSDITSEELFSLIDWDESRARGRTVFKPIKIVAE